MKRESGRTVERCVWECYLACYQYIMLLNHQFIGFSPLNKSAGKATEVGIAIRKLVGRTSVLPTDKGKGPHRGKKKKATDNSPTSPPTLPQAFGKQKAIAY